MSAEGWQVGMKESQVPEYGGYVSIGEVVREKGNKSGPGSVRSPRERRDVNLPVEMLPGDWLRRV